MHAQIINKSPSDWLRDIGEPPAKIAEVLGSFAGNAPLRVCVYRAEHTFLRFHDPKAKTKIDKLKERKIYEPNYWADGSMLGSAFGRASQFEGWLTDEEIARIAKGYYREISAICHNWNDLRDNKLWKIELRGGETVEGLEGPTAPQPTFAAKDGLPATTSKLCGGGTQVYLNPKTPFICTPVNWDAT